MKKQIGSLITVNLTGDCLIRFAKQPTCTLGLYKQHFVKYVFSKHKILKRKVVHYYFQPLLYVRLEQCHWVFTIFGEIFLAYLGAYDYRVLSNLLNVGLFENSLRSST